MTTSNIKKARYMRAYKAFGCLENRNYSLFAILDVNSKNTHNNIVLYSIYIF